MFCPVCAARIASLNSAAARGSSRTCITTGRAERPWGRGGQAIHPSSVLYQAHRYCPDPEWSRQMSSKAFLLLFARLLMSSLFVWDGVLQLRNPGGTARY